MLTFEDQFFTRDAGAQCEEKQCAYAVIQNSDGKFLCADASGRLFLIGGGIEQGETPEQAVVREAQEEAGAQIKLGRKIGQAADYIFGKREQYWLHKICTFYEATIVSTDPSVATDHPTVWLSLEEARPNLRQQSHAWAMEQVLQSRP